MFCFKNMYYKYIVKSTKIFFSIIIICVALFLYLIINAEISVIETFEGSYAEDRLIINEIIEYPVNKLYAYKNRSDKMIEYNVTGLNIIDNNYTVLYVNAKSKNVDLEGIIKIDIEKRQTTLFNIILGKDKRYVEKDMR